MAVTVDMIVEKVFRLTPNGYSQEEVNAFLDEICDTIEAMQAEMSALQDRLQKAESAAVPVPFSAVPAPAPVELKKEEASEAAQKLLAKAQKVYDEMIADAKAEADDILKNAAARADQSIVDLEEKRKTLENVVESLKESAQDYRARFQRLIEEQQHMLNTESALFE